jgi:hypothetical protein
MKALRRNNKLELSRKSLEISSEATINLPVVRRTLLGNLVALLINKAVWLLLWRMEKEMKNKRNSGAIQA